PDHLERMETRFLQDLHFLDRREAGCTEDEARVRPRRDLTAHVLVLVHELHPYAVEVLERDLVPGRPVIPVRAMIRPARLVVRVQRRQRVLLMPGEIHLPREVTARAVDAERRVEGDVPFLQVFQELLPLVTVWRDEIPLPRDLSAT